MAEKSIIELVGDFYQAHMNGEEELRTTALVKIEEQVNKGYTDGSVLADYFNDILSGRTGYNATLSISDYPKESIIRELFQNALGCHYKDGDIKIVVDFLQGNKITISYNEVGFSMEDILYYLSFGMNNGDTTREGRFGIGAKSVFLNVNALSVRSNNFSFKIINDAQKLHIENLNLKSDVFNGTKITLDLSSAEYQRILDNFLTLTEKKGDYINMVELCFAFNRKYLMKSTLSLNDSTVKTVNIAVSQDGKVNNIYRVALHQKDEKDIAKIRFYHNNKSLVDFLHYEKEGFVYLVPFAVANAKRDNIINLLMSKYNYFSTYELTGYIGANNDKFVDEKLSAFFVSVPNTCITHSRTGIRYDKEEAVSKALERDIPAILKEYSKFFVLELKQIPDSEYYYMAPRSYAFDFFNSYMKTSRYTEKIKDSFITGVSIQFPGEKTPVSYEQIREHGFKSLTCNISGTRHKEGSARREFIDRPIEMMKESLKELPDKALYAGYEWENEDGSEKGREYRYEFVKGGNTFVITSDHDGGYSDFEMFSSFSSVIGFYLPTLLEEDCVKDEEALGKILKLFDDCAGEDYTLTMKYYRLHFDRGDENHSFEISKIKVNNIKNAMDILEAHERRFSSAQNFKDVSLLMVASFTQGKDQMTFLRQIKEQGGRVDIILDFNGKPRFQAYGKQFMIPASLTDSDILEIMDDPSVLIESGALSGRKFSFEYEKAVYSLDKSEVANLMTDYASYAETEEIMNGLYVSNLKYDGVAFLAADDKTVCIKHFGQPVSKKEREKTTKYVVLRDDLNKSEFASMVEYIISGEDNGILNRFFSRTKEPNRIIPDQVSLKYRRAPVLDKDEFGFAMEIYDSIKDQKELGSYKSYFAKDISGRLYGYGTCCSVCGEGISYNINAYDLADYSIDVMTEDGEKRFNFSLYLCLNHIADTCGWFIRELSIGGMDPFRWLEEVVSCDSIPPEFFICSIKYTPHLIYDVTPENNGKVSEVVAAEPNTLEFRLTPLMAAKWVIDNRSEN
ncbi:MAG: hypothetical protein NC203_00625 [Firmicutes bacterium]|nr:hypothetical protein [[Eubacterium] siraeum]MCM1486844.1 hypothetical protein [Bacillota bacterium]